VTSVTGAAGRLRARPVRDAPELLADPVRAALAADWALLLDPAVAGASSLVVGSGVRRSKLLVPGAVLAALPGAEVLDGLGRPDGPG
jgi:hypothetical protein